MSPEELADIDPGDIEPYDAYDPTEDMSREELADLAHQAEDAQREYEADLVRDALRHMSKEPARAFLGKYGDAIDARIARLPKTPSVRPLDLGDLAGEMGGGEKV